MNEEPKSIWKKSWKGPRAVLLRVTALSIATFLGMFLFMIIVDWTTKTAFVAFVAVGGFTVIVALLFLTYPIICCWKNFRRFLFGLACLATLIALIYAEEDWRGWHAWNKFKHEWEAKGEKFDFASIIPPPVLDDQNFAMSPVWIAEERYVFQNTPKRAEAWYGNRIYSQEVSNILSFMPIMIDSTNGWGNGAPDPTSYESRTNIVDLKAWQNYYRDLAKTNPAPEFPVASQPQPPAADVLLALSKFDPVIEMDRQASQLPYSRFPVGYDDEDSASILLPHLAAVRRHIQVVQLRAVAELENGQSKKALDDVKLMLCLTDASRSEPFSISHLVRLVEMMTVVQTIGQGVSEHKWSDEQLVALDSELAKLDFLADGEFSIRGELGFATKEINYLRRSRNDDIFYFSENGYNKGDPLKKQFTMVVYRFCPGGWFYQNHIRYCRFFLQSYLPTMDGSRQLAFPASARRANDVIVKEVAHPNPYNFLECLFLPSVGGAFGDLAEKFANGQTVVNLTRTAIALERYRLAHGEYPESLDALAPQFIVKVPHDIIGGQPLHYRRTSDGQFVLYSVGWNERDDGGVVGLTKGGDMDINKGDWVWRYPAR